MDTGPFVAKQEGFKALPTLQIAQLYVMTAIHKHSF